MPADSRGAEVPDPDRADRPGAGAGRLRGTRRPAATAHPGAQPRRRRSIRVVVVGEPKQGKDQLVNSLLGAPVCRWTTTWSRRCPPTSTTAPLHGQCWSAPGRRTTPPGLSRRRSSNARSCRWRPGAGQAAAGDGPAGLGGLVRAEVELPRTFLAGGLELVDTPGIGGLWRGLAGHDRSAAQRGRRRGGLRRLAGVHRAGDGHGPAGRRAVPEPGVRPDEDRRPLGVAADPGARPRSPGRRGDRCSGSSH